MNTVVKSALKGAIPTLVLVGGTNLIVKKFRESKPVLYWGSLAVATGALGFYLLKQNFIPVPKALELNADYTDSDLSHFGKPLEDDEKFTTMQVRIGSPSGSTTSWTTAFNVECIGDEDNLSYLTSDIEDLVMDRVKRWNGDDFDGDQFGDFIPMQIVIGSPSGSTTSWYRQFTVKPVGDEDNLYYLSGEIQDLVVNRVKQWNGDEVIYDAETFDETYRMKGGTKSIISDVLRKHGYEDFNELESENLKFLLYDVFIEGLEAGMEGASYNAETFEAPLLLEEVKRLREENKWFRERLCRHIGYDYCKSEYEKHFGREMSEW